MTRIIMLDFQLL